MTQDEDFLATSNHDGLGQIADFCRVGIARTGVDAMTVAYGTRQTGLELLLATDEIAEQAAQLEVTLGQGPSIDVLSTGMPTVADDLRARTVLHRWPVFAIDAATLGVRAVHAYPIVVSYETVGVVGLYSRNPSHLLAEQHRYAEDVTELIGLALVDPRSTESIGSGLRMNVHQAAGMVMLQAGISIHDALVLLRSTAFVEDSRVADLAADVIAGHRRFDRKEAEVDD